MTFFKIFMCGFKQLPLMKRLKMVKYRTIIMFLFLLIHILILVGQSVIIKKSHFKLNNPTLEENLLPYKKKKKDFYSLSCFFCIMLSISVMLSITQKFHSFYQNAVFYQVSEVNKVSSKIRSFNFKFSLRFRPNN